MKIEKVKLKDVVLYNNNAKNHPQSQIEQIKKSISLFGYNDPIAIDENNMIIEGHGRYLALQELNYNEIEVIRLSHLTELQKKAYIIAHNKINMNTEFNFNALKEEMDSILSSEHIDFSEFGFIIEDIKDDEDLDKVMQDKIIKVKMLECPCCKQKNQKNKFKEILDA